MDTFVDRMEVDRDYRAYALALRSVVTAGQLYYTGYQWVPHAYEELERNGLVLCIFGPHTQDGLRARTIQPTYAGKLAAERLARPEPILAN